MCATWAGVSRVGGGPLRVQRARSSWEGYPRACSVPGPGAAPARASPSTALHTHLPQQVSHITAAGTSWLQSAIQ